MVKCSRWTSLATAVLVTGFSSALSQEPAMPPAGPPVLSALSLSPGTLEQIFQPAQLAYSASVSYLTAAVAVLPVAGGSTMSITVNDQMVESGFQSQTIPLAPGPNIISVVATASDTTSTTYTLSITRSGAELMAHRTYVKSSNAEAGDRFGGVVLPIGDYSSTVTAHSNIAFDGDTLVVGAMGEDSAAQGINGEPADNGATDSGAVYVFRRIGETWYQEAYIKASNSERLDNFGFSVDLSGDTLAVGAIGEDSSAIGINGDESDNGAVRSGAVYIFARNEGVWSQQAYIKPSNTGGGEPAILPLFEDERGDEFGWSVALSGDTLAVGAIGEDSNSTGINGDQGDFSGLGGGTDSGAVYLYTRVEGVWTQEAYVKASNTRFGNQFGHSLALTGGTLVVGAPEEDGESIGVDGDQTQGRDSFHDSGAVYVFSRDELGVWTQEAYLKASNAGRGDQFGNAVAVAGNTLAVGAFEESGNAIGVNGPQIDGIDRSGAAYVFVSNELGWVQEAYVKPSNTGIQDRFGYSLALTEGSLAVGAPHEDSDAVGIGGDELDDSDPRSGAVYHFTRSDLGWVQSAYIKSSNNEDGSFDFQDADQFGISVALAGDILAVGAAGEDSAASGIDGEQFDETAPESGAVYLIR